VVVSLLLLLLITSSFPAPSLPCPVLLLLTPQVQALAGGVDVLVAGPGRAAKLAAGGHLNLNATRALVLDEVDVLCGGWQ
jgi:hypothetical protein